jgi:hypothetical protein
MNAKHFLIDMLTILLMVGCSHTSTLTPIPTLPLGVYVTDTPDPTPIYPIVIPAYPPTFTTITAQPSFCHNGPNKSYLGAIPLSAGIQIEILAIADSGDWFMIRGEGIDHCWVEASILNLSPTIPLNKLEVFTTITTFEETPCRVFPGVEREIQTRIPKERRLVVYGKSNPNAEWILVVPHDSTTPCWIENRFSNDFPNVLYEAALEPTAIFTLVPTVTSTNIRQPVIVMPTNTPRNRGGEGGNLTHTPQPGVTSNTPVPPIATLPPPTTTPIPPTYTPIMPPTSTPVPPPTPTPTLCWPPGHCK